MIRINMKADLDDLFGGQLDFEVSIESRRGPDDFEILGCGHTVPEAIADARKTTRTWAMNARRERLAVAANLVAAQSRNGGAPVLAWNSTVDQVAAWLQWCDANGAHTRELAALNDFDFYTLPEAWDALDQMIAD